MKTISKILTTTAIAITATLGNSAISAHAFTIERENNPVNLLDNLLGDTAGLSNFQARPIGDGRAFGTFADDPFNLDSGIVLSTGRVTDLVGENTADGSTNASGNDLSTDFGETGTMGDSILLEISFDADDSQDFLYFQYVFGSEEFIEYGGSSFNDDFSLTLNGRNFARLSDGNVLNINNLVPNQSSLFGSHPDFVYNPAGSGIANDEIKLDGYTQRTVEDLSLLQPLVFQAPLNQNARNNLLISVRDVNDGIYDTAVFFRGETLGTAEPSPIIPEGGTGTGGEGNGNGNGGNGTGGEGEGGTGTGTGGEGNGNGNGGNGTGGETTIPEPNFVLGIIVFSLSTILGYRKRCKKIA